MDTHSALILACTGLGALAVAGIVGCIMLRGRARSLEQRYSGIADADDAVAKAKKTLEELTAQSAQQVETRSNELKSIEAQYKEAKQRHEALGAEIALLEENLEDVSFGVYKPHFDYQTPNQYKLGLSAIRDREKLAIRSGSAAHCDVAWGQCPCPRQIARRLASCRPRVQVCAGSRG